MRQLRKEIMPFINKDCPAQMIDVKICEIPDYDSYTLEQIRFRSNPANHRKLKDAITLRQIAIMENDYKKQKQAENAIKKLRAKLGYRDYPAVNSDKYKRVINKITNISNPFQGGGCSPR